jgi:hypothetical protein
MNWYKKVGWSTGTPVTFDLDKIKKNLDPYKGKPDEKVTPNPFFGGDIRGDFAKDPANLREDEPGYYKDIPSGRTILDDDIYTGEGTNKEEWVDDKDKMPLKKRMEPIGPNNMQGRALERDVYDYVSKKSKLRSINKT